MESLCENCEQSCPVIIEAKFDLEHPELLLEMARDIAPDDAEDTLIDTYIKNRTIIAEGLLKSVVDCPEFRAERLASMVRWDQILDGGTSKGLAEEANCLNPYMETEEYRRLRPQVSTGSLRKPTSFPQAQRRLQEAQTHYDAHFADKKLGAMRKALDRFRPNALLSIDMGTPLQELRERREELLEFALNGESGPVA